MTKRAVRTELRERLAQLSVDEVRARSAAACSLLATQPVFRKAETIMIFLSMPQEVDTSPLAQEAWLSYKTVLAPRVSWEQRRMLPTEIQSLSDDVESGPLGVREPVSGLPVPVGEIDLVVVPGLGFDGQGNRLGRGRGFYDRFLAHRDFRGVTCALAFEFQVIQHVPAEENDVRMDMLVTDEQVRHFKALRPEAANQDGQSSDQQSSDKQSTDGAEGS